MSLSLLNPSTSRLRTSFGSGHVPTPLRRRDEAEITYQVKIIDPIEAFQESIDNWFSVTKKFKIDRADYLNSHREDDQNDLAWFEIWSKILIADGLKLMLHAAHLGESDLGEQIVAEVNVLEFHHYLNHTGDLISEQEADDILSKTFGE